MLRHMTKIEWLNLAASLCMGILLGVFVKHFFDLISPLDKNIELSYTVFMAVVLYNLGERSCSFVISSIRSKKIQAELDMEKAMRTIRGENY